MGGCEVMDYLWRNYNPQMKYQLDFSMNQSEPHIEVSSRKDNVAVINPLPRFAKIFRALLSRKDLCLEKKSEVQELANCLFHFLAQSDRLSGISSALVVEDELEFELLNGKYGNCIKNSFCNLNRERQRIILDFLRRQEDSKGSRLYFREAVKNIFPQAGIYYHSPDKIFLLYLPQDENSTDSDCINLLVNLFLDVTAKWQIYWKYPFGIIGRKQTMQINKMRLYG